MVVASEKPAQKSRAAAEQPRERAPPFWTGMNFGGWWRLLRRNHFAVDWRHWPIAIAITLMSVFHTIWGRWQTILIGWWLRKAEIKEPPLFVLGHWRSGTTLLHEMMVLDVRHTSPTTYACLAPNHFVITESFARRWLKFVLPKHRPMDKMPAGWERPQEEEFALCNLGIPSQYLTIAFPNHPPQDTEYLTLEGLSKAELDTWKRALMRFLRHVSYMVPKRLVLKSPPHTCRIGVLLEMFPDAKFVHIVRDPYAVFASTTNLWKKLYTKHGLQTPRMEGNEEYVLETFERMYDKFERERDLIGPGRFCEVRYEDLVRDPLGELRAIYDKLDLGGFEELRPALESYLASMNGYQTNRYPQLTDAERAKVAARWSRCFEQYGYEK